MVAKKVLSIALTTLLLSALLLGCAVSPSPSASAPAQEPKTTDTSTTDPVAPPPADEPEDKSLTWWATHGFLPNAVYGSADESPFHSILSEMVGVKINWQFPTAGTDGNQAFNVMMASDTLPDIVYHGLMADAGRYIDEGTIRDLTPYLEKNSPAYYAFLKSKEIYDRSMKTDAGQYYGYGFFREDGGWNDSYLGPVIRQDWLDALSLEAPKTISDWDTIIKAFKDKYDAKLSFAWSRWNNTGLAGAFGAYASINHKIWVDDSGKVHSSHAEPQWRDQVAKYNEWWKEGLLDQDVLTMTDKEAQTKALNGNMGISYTSMGQVSNWEKDANTAGNGAKWVGLQWPTSDDGKLSMVFGGYGIGDSVSVITTSCPDEKLAMAMRVLDYAYTPEGHLYWNFGKQGNSWEYDSNGKPAYTKLVTEDPDGLNNAIDKFGGSTWSGSTIQATLLLYLKNTPTAIAANDLWFYPNEAVSAKHNMPRVSFTADESNRLQELNSAINTYISEMSAKFITGEEPLSNYDNFVAELKKMGLQEVLDINQVAYDRFSKR